MPAATATSSSYGSGSGTVVPQRILRDTEPHGRRPRTATRMETRRRVQDVEAEATSGVREEEEGCRMPPIRLAEAAGSREDDRRVARVRVPGGAAAASGRGRVDRGETK
jgi:hypothetical protein